MAKKMAGSGKVDVFPNFYRATFAEGVAGTMSFTAWNTGFSIKDGIAFVVHKLLYRIGPSYLAEMTAMSDQIGVGLVTNNLLTTGSLYTGISDSIVDSLHISQWFGTAVGFNICENEWVHDFTNEPGGGRIVAPKPLYFAVQATGLANPVNVQVQVVYTMIRLSEPLYRELYESMNPSA